MCIRDRLTLICVGCVLFSGRTGKYILKPNTHGKAAVWKSFSIVYEKGVESEDLIQNVTCCNKCFKCYQLKDARGRPNGTKNLIDHLGRCSGPVSQGQLQLTQCLKSTPNISKNDMETLKRKQVEYCVDGYNSFRSVEHKGLLNLLQTCVDYGAKYGTFDLAKILYSRVTVSRATLSMAAEMKARLVEEIKVMVQDGTVSLCLDMYTDDYRKKSYLDVHATWICREFLIHHTALAVRHFGTAAHTGDNIRDAVSEILGEYGIPEEETPVTTDHGSNVVAALRNCVRLDCMCHRLHTVLETAWAETKRSEPEAVEYESAVADLCRYVKQATGIQEQLRKSLKHGGDTRPWTSMYRRAEAVEASYEDLVTVLTTKNRLELIANVNRGLNKAIMELTRSIKTVFESLEKIDEPTLHLVVPSYYLLMSKFAPGIRDSAVILSFRGNIRKYLDQKFWTSIKAFHWMATFLDPSFKQLDFILQTTNDDARFKRDLKKDIDDWMSTEMQSVADKMAEAEGTNSEEEPRYYSIYVSTLTLAQFVFIFVVGLE